MPSGPGAREFTPGLAGSFSAELDFIERRGLSGEHPVVLLKSPLSELPSKGAASPDCRWDTKAVMEILTEVKLSVLPIPGNTFPCGERHSDH